jgi:hypothetical protein
LLELLSCRLGVALLERVSGILEILGRLGIIAGHLSSLLRELFSQLLAFSLTHLLKLTSQVIELICGLLKARALGWLASRERLEVTGHLLKRGTARIGVRIKALLQTRLGSRQIGQRLLAVALIGAQLLLKGADLA